jgi:hypothetical protein
MTINYPEQAHQQEQPPPQRSWWGKLPKGGKIALIVGGIVVVVLAVLVAVTIKVNLTAATWKSEVVPVPTPAPVTTAPGVVPAPSVVIPPGGKLPSAWIELPDVKDMRASDVSELLGQVGLTKVTFVSSRTSEVPRDLQNWVVDSINPAPGSTVTPETPITVSVHKR